MSAVVELINRHRDLLNLSTDTDCFDGSGVNDVISYFEHNPLNNNNNLNIFMQDCCFRFKKKTAINAGPVKN